MRDPQAIYDAHLAGVSRSFAACIAELTQPLRSYVSLSYLLCRVVDTLEDAPWASLPAQQHSFLWFDRAVRSLPTQKDAMQWRATIPTQVPDAERALLDDGHSLLRDLHALPGRVRRVLQQTLLCMSYGMRRYMQRKAARGQLVLTDLADVNRYCFIVAGVVGTLLTRLFHLTHKQAPRSRGMAQDSVHFGLLLQKVNLLKDQSQDEREGRYLVPNRQLMAASLRTHAERASRYLLRVPAEAQSFRRFCGWSLFLAANSLSAIEAAPGGKIPRAQTQALFAEVGQLCRSNTALRAALRQAIATLPAFDGSPSRAPHAAMASWLCRLPGHRRQADLAEALR